MTLPRFYEQRGYQPAWIDDSGLKPQVEGLVRMLRAAAQEGLNPLDYHLTEIEAKREAIRADRRRVNPDRLTELDLLLTDAYLLYGYHLLAGKVNPETIDPEWFIARRKADLVTILQNALDSNQVEASLRSLLPSHSGYYALRGALAAHRAIAAQGGWAAVPDGPGLRKGDRDPRVESLRVRLTAAGDLETKEVFDKELFDEDLDRALQKFQGRHGLNSSGGLNANTLTALNLPAEVRVRQIMVNMERCRWLPQDLGEQYIMVNIANFELDVVEADRVVMTMRVVVDRPYRRTPVFSDMITYLVFCPYWHVPKGIAAADILPQLRRDIGYLTQNNIKVFPEWGPESKEIDPTGVDWFRVNSGNLNYRFRQEPGPSNALGRIKFMFPNKFNVYLHDTPSRELFAVSERTFSSGCIRIERPLDLAEYLLRDEPGWKREKIIAVIEKNVEQTKRLPRPVTIHLLYLTAWAENDGRVQFRNDIYLRDEPVYQALTERPVSIDGRE
ncbi:MAG: L,D-transpeptidase family protein [Deltaproteobacteria bacterium]|nr:MAG: L,D-transpeptidase family protein [Deltaproteobacteria bacterium]